MISDFIDSNVEENKSGPMFYAMAYYNDLRKQVYDKNAIFILKDKLDWLGDNGTEQDMDEDLCASAVFAYVELCMAELMYEGMRDIKKMEDLYQATYIREHINEGFKTYKTYNEWPDDIKKDTIRHSLWNYEDEVLAMQNSVKFTLATVMRAVGEINHETDKVSMNDMLGIYNELYEKLKDTGLPTMSEEMDDDEIASLDLISSSMFSDDYIMNVVDFCFKKS
tara:strand:+ start:161 stop:829 length:669 start_codon:yes stop_codon:yes gene_type:complete